MDVPNSSSVHKVLKENSEISKKHWSVYMTQIQLKNADFSSFKL